MPVTKTVVLDSLTAISPFLEKVEGVCAVGNKIVLTYDNDCNVADAGSAPANPHADGPFVQLELVGANYPKIFIVPMPDRRRCHRTEPLSRPPQWLNLFPSARAIGAGGTPFQQSAACVIRFVRKYRMSAGPHDFPAVRRNRFLSHRITAL